MALTSEHQAQIDIQTAVENARHTNQLETETRRAKLEAIRLAKEVLVENARSKPVDSREVTAEDIKTFADKIILYINT